MKKSATINRWLKAGWLLAVLMILSSGAAFGVDQLVQTEHTAVENELHQLRTVTDQTEIGEVGRKLDELNATASLLTQITPDEPDYSARLSRLLNVLPSGVTVSNITLTRDGRVTVSGLATSRSDFLALDEALKGADFLTSVTTASAANKRDNLPFEYSAQFLPSSS